MVDLNFPCLRGMCEEIQESKYIFSNNLDPISITG